MPAIKSGEPIMPRPLAITPTSKNSTTHKSYLETGGGSRSPSENALLRQSLDGGSRKEDVLKGITSIDTKELRGIIKNIRSY